MKKKRESLLHTLNCGWKKREWMNGESVRSECYSWKVSFAIDDDDDENVSQVTVHERAKKFRTNIYFLIT